MVGPEGRVTGLDMTPEILAKARAGAADAGLENVEFVEGEAEQLPFPDESFDFVISNGVIDLVPDRKPSSASFTVCSSPAGGCRSPTSRSNDRSPRRGAGRSTSGPGEFAGALLEAEYATLLERHGFERIEAGNLVATHARSAFEDTRQKAIKYGAHGTTVRAYKPARRRGQR
jgi:arsenite methyltransferase